MNPPAPPPTSAGRILVLLFGLPLLAVLLGGALAPWAFNGLTALGRARPALSFLRELEFESVLGRCVLVSLILVLPAVLRLSGLRSWRDLGWPAGTRASAFFRPFAWGAGTLLALFFLGWALGAYDLRVEPRAWKPGSVLMIVAGALVVGVIEESLFRGFYYGSLRRVGGPWTAALVSSLWFAAVHFAQPFARIGVVHAGPLDGLRMIGDCFYLDHHFDHYVPFILTLFVMGLALCRATERTGSLHRAAGLHAGWVLSMRWGIYLWDRVELPSPGWFGGSDLVSKSWVAFFFALLWWGWEERRARVARAPR